MSFDGVIPNNIIEPFPSHENDFPLDSVLGQIVLVCMGRIVVVVRFGARVTEAIILRDRVRTRGPSHREACSRGAVLVQCVALSRLSTIVARQLDKRQRLNTCPRRLACWVVLRSREVEVFTQPYLVEVPKPVKIRNLVG